MIWESVAILAVGILLLSGFVRAKHLGYAFAVLPVAVIPTVYLFAAGILYFVQDKISFTRPPVLLAFINVIAMAVTCVLIALVGRRIQSQRNRRLYQVIMLIYTVLLGWSYIYDALQPLL